LAGLLQSGQPINRIPLGFGTDGDGASFRMLIKGIVTVFQEAEIMIVAMEYNVDLGLQHQITKIIK
jgi:hypothetical protein